MRRFRRAFRESLRRRARNGLAGRSPGGPLRGESQRDAVRTNKGLMPANDHLSDTALLKHADPTGERFAAFYRRHVRTLFGHLARQDVDPAAAADVVAETFLTALVRRESFDERRGSAEAWLGGIARHKLGDQRRGNRRVRRLAGRLKVELPALVQEDIDSYQELRGGDAHDAIDDPRIAAAIEALPERQRQAVLARVVRDQPYDALARSLETSEMAARKQVSRGLAALRRVLSE
jgi:RNA polymerase sigma factor (sigma-70 family)